MAALQIVGWLAIITGGIAAFYGATEGAVFFIGAGLSAVVSGLLYLALARGLDLLAQIRDRLPVPGRADATSTAPSPDATAPAGSLADLERRLDDIKRR